MVGPRGTSVARLEVVEYISQPTGPELVETLIGANQTPLLSVITQPECVLRVQCLVVASTGRISPKDRTDEACADGAISRCQRAGARFARIGALKNGSCAAIPDICAKGRSSGIKVSARCADWIALLNFTIYGGYAARRDCEHSRSTASGRGRVAACGMRTTLCQWWKVAASAIWLTFGPFA